MIYKIGSATNPVSTPAVIAHICNDVGGWGAGFVMALSRENKNPEKKYREWFKNKKERVGNLDLYNNFKLGNIQFVDFGNRIEVCNMIAQTGLGFTDNLPPIRYEALENCLSKLNHDIKLRSQLGLGDYTIHMPRIGAGLAGGDWTIIEKIIQKTLTACEVYVYTLPNEINYFPKANYV